MRSVLLLGTSTALCALAACSTATPPAGTPSGGSTGTTTTASTLAPCLATDSVSGSTVPCRTGSDSVSGTVARISTVLREGTRVLPLAGVSVTCRALASATPVPCRLGVIVDSLPQATAASPGSDTGGAGKAR